MAITNSVRQQRLAQSSTESEYYAAAEAVKEAARTRALHHDLGYRTGPITVYEDNQSCIKQAENPCDREAQKHIDLRAHYLREQVHANNVKMVYVSTGEQVADGFLILALRFWNYQHLPLINSIKTKTFQLVESLRELEKSEGMSVFCSLLSGGVHKLC